MFGVNSCFAHRGNTFFWEEGRVHDSSDNCFFGWEGRVPDWIPRRSFFGGEGRVPDWIPWRTFLNTGDCVGAEFLSLSFNPPSHKDPTFYFICYLYTRLPQCHASYEKKTCLEINGSPIFLVLSSVMKITFAATSDSKTVQRFNF